MNPLQPRKAALCIAATLTTWYLMASCLRKTKSLILLHHFSGSAQQKRRPNLDHRRAKTRS
jgi:hypothetical protein